jgi:hypothetical protein
MTVPPTFRMFRSERRLAAGTPSWGEASERAVEASSEELAVLGPRPGTRLSAVPNACGRAASWSTRN